MAPALPAPHKGRRSGPLGQGDAQGYGPGGTVSSGPDAGGSLTDREGCTIL